MRIYLISSFSAVCVWGEDGRGGGERWQKALLMKMSGNDPDFDLGGKEIFQPPPPEKLNVFDKVKG